MPRKPAAAVQQQPAAAEQAPPPLTSLASAGSLTREEAQAAWCRPRMPQRYADLHVNYIVLGESGLGKTSFINNLISSFAVTRHGKDNDGGATSMDQFQADPASLRTVLEPMDIPESSRRLIIALQDMPGWGEDVNLRRYLHTVVAYILEQRERDYEQLSHAKAVSAETMYGQLQHSITACLYFLPPHRVKKIDLILMAAISQLVTIIPVIAKSDSMTDPELAAYRQEVNTMLSQPQAFIASDSSSSDGGGSSVCRVKAAAAAAVELQLFGIGAEVLATLDISQLPMAVMCSRELEPCGDAHLLSLVGPDGLSDPHQPVRSYRHGSVHPYEQSDLIALKRLLLGDQVESIYALAEDSYSRYQAFCEAYEEAEEQVGALVHAACLVGRLLEFDEFHLVHGRLLEAKVVVKQMKAANAELRDQLALAMQVNKELSQRSWRR